MALALGIGAAHLVMIEQSRTRGGGRSEYLLILRDQASEASALRYVDSHPEVSHVGSSIYPHSVRVALEVPVGGPRKTLEAQSFTAAVLPVTPLLFCH